MPRQPGITLSVLQAQLAAGKIAPVYIVAGPETFLADEAVRAIADALRSKGAEISQTLYRGDEVDAADVLDGLRTGDLYCFNRLAVVLNADGFIGRFATPLSAYALAPARGACLVLVASEIDGRRKLTRVVQDGGGLVACNRMYPRDVPAWIEARVRQMDRQIEPRAVSLLVEFLGTELGMIAAELEKLAAYRPERKKIAEVDVEAVCLRDRGRSMYELTDAIGARRPAEVLAVLDRLLEQERASCVLFGVSRHMRRLWAAKELIENGIEPATAARQLGVNFFIPQFLAQINAFSIAELRRCCSALARCENELKRSGLDERILIETTLLAVLRRAGEKAPRS